MNQSVVIGGITKPFENVISSNAGEQNVLGYDCHDREPNMGEPVGDGTVSASHDGFDSIF